MLSIGGGANYYQAAVKVEKNLNYAALGLPGSPDGNSTLKMDGYGWGWNMGLMFKPNERHSVGFMYRSFAKIKVTGSGSFDNIPLGLQLVNNLSGPHLSSNAKSVIRLPSDVTLGYAIRPVPRLKIEFDADWINWSCIDQDYTEFENPIIAGLVQTREDKHWRDVIMYNFGMEYNLTKKATLRCGAGFSKTPIPEVNFKSDIPQADKCIVTVGFSYAIKRIVIDLAYGAGFSFNRKIDNSVGAASGASMDGKYEAFTNIASANLTYKF
jgi:long-chain fatty acid transport protein